MNRSKTSKLFGVALLTAVLSGLGVRAASAQREPRMETALRLLQDAREELRGVRGDRGGHREQALDFTVRVIRQVEEGIDVDRHRERR